MEFGAILFLQTLGAFGVGLTMEQIEAIDVLILAAFLVVTLLLAFLARQNVTPTARANNVPEKFPGVPPRQQPAST